MGCRLAEAVHRHGFIKKQPQREARRKSEAFLRFTPQRKVTWENPKVGTRRESSLVAERSRDRRPQAHQTEQHTEASVASRSVASFSNNFPRKETKSRILSSIISISKKEEEYQIQTPEAPKPITKSKTSSSTNRTSKSSAKSKKSTDTSFNFNSLSSAHHAPNSTHSP